MAEQVQATLDRMVSDLVLFQKDSPFSTLLSPTELQSIVEKRRDNEYLLRRRNPRCSDFLNYIQYETKLYQLLQLRFDKHIKADKSISSSSTKTSQKAIRKEYQQKVVRPILQHIHLLYIRTLRRYKHQFTLFQQYADFCRQVSSYQRLHVCYQDALKYHAHNLQLWYDMIQYEFRNLFSEDRSTVRTPTTISSLRTILQRGIRLHPTSIQLWLYSLQVELQYIKTRSSLLTTAGDSTSNNLDSEDTVQKYYPLIVVIYDHALQSLQKDERRLTQFHVQCIDLLYEYWDPPHTDAIVQHIVDAVAKLGSEEGPPSQLWYILRATLLQAVQQQQVSSPDSGAENAVLQIMQEACQAIPTSEMIVTALQFLRTHCLRPLLRSSDDPNNKIFRICSMIQKLYREYREKEPQRPACVAAVIYEYVQHLVQDVPEEGGTDCVRRAKEELKDFINENAKRGDIPSYVWIQYAELIYRDSSRSDVEGGSLSCITVLQQALQCIPMHQQADYFNVLEQLFCVFTDCRTNSMVGNDNSAVDLVSDTAILKLLDEIVLLSPGRSDGNKNRMGNSSVPSRVVVSSIPNLPSACCRFVQYSSDQLQQHSLDPHSRKSIEQLFRKICDKVLVESNLLSKWLNDSQINRDFSVDLATAGAVMDLTNASSALVVVQQLFDVVMEVEVDYLRVIRLHDKAIHLFQKYCPSWVQFYQEQKADSIRYSKSGSVITCEKTRANKRQKLNSYQSDSPNSRNHGELLTNVPVLNFTDATADTDKLTELYRTYQVLHVKSDNIRSSASNQTSPTKFCWEDIGPLFDELNDADKASFCLEKTTNATSETIQAKTFLSSHSSNKDRSYCSFLLQKTKELYHATLDNLPFQEFPKTNWTYEPTLWFFFGRNFIGSTTLDGRPEHTDSVSHDGTWHYQLSGTKRWFIRPTSELLNQVQLANLSSSSEWCVDCKEGDILIINTRLWFHRTVIPPQRMPSVSYARDFRFGDAPDASCHMTNVDGLYATEDISKGTIIFSETDMPDCELHRSSIDPNCEVVVLEDGTSAVMSTRQIKAGEFFCVPESSEEEFSESRESDSCSLHSIE